MAFVNVYEDVVRAQAYAKLEFARTYYLAYRDLPEIIAAHVKGKRALDFGCGTGRSARFLRKLGLDVIAIDIAQHMVSKAREIDPGGDYRRIQDGDFSQFQSGIFDVVLSAFTFDNIPGFEGKVRLFRGLASLLKSDGRIINLVSSPEIYMHEWASFSTKDFPENRSAASGDVVKIIVTDHEDQRPVEDVLWTDEAYREVFAGAGLAIAGTYKPLATGNEPWEWVNETRIAPWVIYVLRGA